MNSGITKTTDEVLVAEVRVKLKAATDAESQWLKNGVTATKNWYEAGSSLSRLMVRRKALRDWGEWVKAQKFNHATVLSAIEFYEAAKPQWTTIKGLTITEARRELGLLRSQKDADRASRKAARSEGGPSVAAGAIDHADAEACGPATPPNADKKDWRKPTAEMRRKPIAKLSKICASMQAATSVLSDRGKLDGTDLTLKGADDLLAALRDVVADLTAALEAAADWARGRATAVGDRRKSMATLTGPGEQVSPRTETRRDTMNV